MKNKNGYSSNYSLYEHLRKQFNMIPMIRSAAVTSETKQLSFKRSLYPLQPALLQPESKENSSLTDTGKENVIMQTVKGIVRSFVFINWKDHA